jgi:hypothetical protein
VQTLVFTEAAISPRLPTAFPPSLSNAIALGRSVSEFLQGNSDRSHSFRSLARREFPQHATSSLWRAYSIFRLATQYPEVTQFTYLGVGHMSVALTLRDPLRIEVLREAEVNRWSRRHLEAEIRIRRAAEKSRVSTTSPEQTH